MTALCCSAAGVSAPLATAAPDSCAYILSAPQVTNLPGGATGVTATLRPGSCTGNAQAAMSTVCLSTGEGPGICSHAPGWDPAEAFVAASHPTGTFRATGIGCWRVMPGSGTVCMNSDPTTTTM
jgi:hypothetical protein